MLVTMFKITVIENMAPALQTIIIHINQMAANKHKTARDKKKRKREKEKENPKLSNSSAERGVRMGAQASPCRSVGSLC